MSQVLEAEPLPPGPLTVTVNRCDPVRRPESCHGEEHGTAAA